MPVFEQMVKQRLLALFFAACLLFNFPLLGLWDRDVVVFGVPILLIALFALWGMMIVLVAWLMERSEYSSQDD
ncbi:MAG: hypothetical protein FD135_5352 [Comamonadaceae bacterium]|nr:MAG: hypothetical protein FD135_5352 [Comamonadaceae bacterium]